MITGYNTDIEHDGVVYHVQTEDKGLESPLILSLVYSGGAILASKRARYEDLIASGFSDEALSERLMRQHKLICAAIYAGRLEDLKRMGSQAAEEIAPETVAKIEITPRDLEREAAEAVQAPAPPEETLTPAPSFVEHATAYTVHDQRRLSVMGELPAAGEGLRITLLDAQEFRSGEKPTLSIMVTYRSAYGDQPMPGVAVSVKVLGTTFRPRLSSAKTGADGVAVVTTQIPEFSSGRAAILIRAEADDSETELRRVILPG